MGAESVARLFFNGGTGLLQRLVDRYDFDFAQIQLNYIDWELLDAKRQCEIVRTKAFL